MFAAFDMGLARRHRTTLHRDCRSPYELYLGFVDAWAIYLLLHMSDACPFGPQGYYIVDCHDLFTGPGQWVATRN